MFFQDGLTRNGSGFGFAIELAEKHIIQWSASNNTRSGSIRSDVTAANTFGETSMVFGNGSLGFFAGGKASFQIVYTASGVNNVQVQTAATAGAPVVRAVGDDTNIDLALGAKGSGAVRSASPLDLPVLTASSIANPPAGFMRLFFNSANANRLSSKDSAGTVTAIKDA